MCLKLVYISFPYDDSLYGNAFLHVFTGLRLCVIVFLFLQFCVIVCLSFYISTACNYLMSTTEANKIYI